MTDEHEAQLEQLLRLVPYFRTAVRLAAIAAAVPVWVAMGLVAQ